MSPYEDLHLHRILVAVDGSPASELAVTAAVTAARRDNATITLLAVVLDVHVTAAWGMTTPDPRTLREEAERAAETLLRETVARIPEEISVTTLVRHGKPGPEIVAQARERDYDAILLGARGVGRFGGLIGSVSSYVMHHAGTAVFVAHPPPDAD